MSGYAWRHIRSVLVAPATALVVIPGLILALQDRVAFGGGLAPPARGVAIAAGAVLIAGGLVLLVATVRLFFRHGEGTLLPWDATQRLVVVGIYRHVRNPMMAGVLAIALGEALLFGSWPIGVLFAAALALNLVYIPLVEERGLKRRFGADYERYRANVPRWLPRLRPWDPETGSRSFPPTGRAGRQP